MTTLPLISATPTPRDPWYRKRRIKVYFADAYSSPYPIHNMHDAMRMWLQLWKSGYIPTCPHWTGFQDMMTPLPYEVWLEYDDAILPYHHIMLRGVKKSGGADKEVEFAQRLGMPVVYSIEELLSYMPPDTDPSTLVYNPIYPRLG